jgi:DNA-binding IclR family transcriptional regulator
MDDIKAIVGAGPRTLETLKCVAELAPDFSLAEISARLDLPPSTVHRLLKAFISANLVERTHDRTYRVGAELYRIASLIVDNFDLGALARPELLPLWKVWKETTTFALYRPYTGKGMIVEAMRSPNPLQFTWEALQDFELVWGAQGLAILAYLSNEEIEAAIDNAPSGPLSSRPLPPRDDLLAYLEEVRRSGYANLRDADIVNLAGVAAPVFRAGGSVIGSIGVIMPATRFNLAREAELIDMVVGAGKSLSAKLGWRN